MDPSRHVQVDTGGGAFNAVGSVIGGDGNRVATNASPVSIAGAGAAPPAHAEVLACLRAIQEQLAASGDLPPGVRDDLRDDLAGAADSIDREEPNLARAKSRLQCMKEVLDTLTGSAASAAALGGMVLKALQLVGRFAG